MNTQRKRIYSTPLMLTRPIILAQISAAKVVLMEACLQPDTTERLNNILINIEMMIESLLQKLEAISIDRQFQLDAKCSKEQNKKYNEMLKKMINELFVNLRLTAALAYAFKSIFLNDVDPDSTISLSSNFYQACSISSMVECL